MPPVGQEVRSPAFAPKATAGRGEVRGREGQEVRSQESEGGGPVFAPKATAGRRKSNLRSESLRLRLRATPHKTAGRRKSAVRKNPKEKSNRSSLTSTPTAADTAGLPIPVTVPPTNLSPQQSRFHLKFTKILNLTSSKPPTSFPGPKPRTTNQQTASVSAGSVTGPSMRG